MKICKAPTLRLKALNKHPHIMYIEMGNVIQKKEKEVNKGSSITMQTMHTHTHARTHTHTVQTDRSEGQCGLTEIF